MSADRRERGGDKAPEALPPRGGSRWTRGQRTSRPGLALGATILWSQADFHSTGMPWWALYSLVVLWVGHEYLRSVFPQESLHMLAWWSKWWDTRRPNHRQDKPGGDDHRAPERPGC